MHRFQIDETATVIAITFFKFSYLGKKFILQNN